MRRPPVWLLFLTPVIFFGGCITGGLFGVRHAPADPQRAIYARLPHHVPPAPDAAAFRFAMVHDVIHERYPKHGPAYYQERERLAREKMPGFHPDSETVYALTDDIAVGLARQGRTDEAIALMRDKLKRQQAIGLTGKDLYSTYANLAEFLIQANLRPMLGGDAAARARFQEGRDFLRKSIEVNPKAHFGREGWQVVAVDAWLEFGASPEELKRTDLIGNRLDNPYLEARHVTRNTVFGSSYDQDWTWRVHTDRGHDEPAERSLDAEQRAALRKFITKVGKQPEVRLVDDVARDQEDARGKRAPFDEPALWLIGEWRQGAGPNPHFALCLGEIMLRVGQRYIAWNCFERASRMAEQFAPQPDSQQFLRDHCRSRQKAIERSLPDDEAAGLRPKFEAELAFGEAYQRDYQAYEEEKIRAGANLNDAHFYDEFLASRPAIASKVGPEEWYAGTSGSGEWKARFQSFWAWGLLVGGASVLAIALIVRFRYRQRGTPLAVGETNQSRARSGGGAAAGAE